MDQTHSEEFIRNTKNLTYKMVKPFSEKMEELRKPFLCNENPKNFNTLKKHFRYDNGNKEILRTVSDIDTPDSSAINSEQTHLSSTQTSVDIETSDISDYFTDDSKNKTNSFRESDTSMDASIELFKPIENSSNSDQFKNSTFITQSKTTTIVFQDKSFKREEAKTKLTENFRSDTIFTKPKPLILINGERFITKTFTRKQDNINHSEYEENKRLRAKIIQLELLKQIENKDKAMSQLLELSKSEDFPKLKHLCNAECVRDKDGLCKKIKQRLKNGAKQNEDYYGVLHYVWSTITYPFSSVSPNTQKLDEGVVKIINLYEEEKNLDTKCYIEEKHQKETSANGNIIDNKYLDHKSKTPREKTKSYRITDYIWGGQREDKKSTQELVEYDNLKENVNENSMKRKICNENSAPNSEEINHKIEKNSKSSREKAKSYRITDYIWGGQREDNKSTQELVEYDNLKENVNENFMKRKICNDDSAPKSEEINHKIEKIEKKSKTSREKAKSYRITDYIWGGQREDYKSTQDLVEYENLKENVNENSMKRKICNEDSAQKSEEINHKIEKIEKNYKSPREKAKSYRITDYIWGGQREDKKSTQELVEIDNLKENVNENSTKRQICNEDSAPKSEEINHKIEKNEKYPKRQKSYLYFFKKAEKSYNYKDDRYEAMPKKETEAIENMEDIFTKMAKEEHST